MVVVAVPAVPVVALAVAWGNAELFPWLCGKAYILRIQTHHLHHLDYRGLAQGLALSSN